MDITALDKPKYYQLRWKLSNLFISIASKIYPRNPELKAFYLQMLTDQMFYGKSIVRIDPSKE